MAQKPSIPKGTRDFSPTEMVKRNYIFDTIKSVFVKYGYLPIETPAMENLSTLMGKYGEEGDKLLFKILNSGDYLSKANSEAIDNKNSNQLISSISEKGLRYDLTVPFARYVVQYQNDIQFPFKRYQVQPVWRADRPQKGRYREFYQCDVDVVGSRSLLNELELLQIVEDVYKQLSIGVVVKINNRKILAGIAEIIHAADKMIDITVAIDKLEKTGINKVREELESKGLSTKQIETLEPVLKLEGTNEEKLTKLEKILKSSETGLAGIAEMNKLFQLCKLAKLGVKVHLDLTLARGLNYYTGCIFEVKCTDMEMGSITGGGRYDDLTSIFGLKDISGVGISFGAERIFDVLEHLNRFPNEVQETTKIMFVNFGEQETMYCLSVANKLRALGIKTEVFPDPSKMKKQMAYANKKNIPYVVLAGENEIKEDKITLKNMNNGQQQLIDTEKIMDYIN